MPGTVKVSHFTESQRCTPHKSEVLALVENFPSPALQRPLVEWLSASVENRKGSETSLVGRDQSIQPYSHHGMFYRTQKKHRVSPTKFTSININIFQKLDAE